jgi:pteridine reductase
MSEGLQGKVVLITGGARRVGATIARTLHAAGATVLLHYRHSAQAAERLEAEFNTTRPGSAACIQADLLDIPRLSALVETAIERFGRLDALVNNASSFFPTPLGGIDEAAWDDLVGSNFKAPLFLTQAAATYLKESRGAVVNITDIHAERPLRGYPLYCAAKAALLGLTRALAQEMAPLVRVNAVAPGPVLWPEDDSFASPTREQIIADTLLQRAGTPEDIARAVRYLLLDAPYVTGQVINVDGGRTAHL